MEQQQQNKISKIRMAKEILEAFTFLGIAHSELRTRRIQAGNIQNLYNETAKQLGA